MLPIKSPDFLDRMFSESRQVLWIVHIPTGRDVMNTPDQIIPRSLSSESLDPGFVPFDKIAFETQADREPVRSHLFNHLKVARQILDRHAPRIKLFRHRVMVGEPDLGESGSLRGLEVLDWIAHRVVAQCCMDVVVGAYGAHATMLFRRTEIGNRRTSRADVAGRTESL